MARERRFALSVAALVVTTTAALVPTTTCLRRAPGAARRRPARAVRLFAAEPPSLDEELARLDALDDLSPKRVPKPPTLDEELDRLDDMTSTRPSKKRSLAPAMWGANLDADIAGRKATGGEAIIKAYRDQVLPAITAGSDEPEDADSPLTADEKAEIFYAEAVDYMKRGDYRVAVRLFDRAVVLAGRGSRRGGQYALWLAQAQQSAGDRRPASALLKLLKKHADRDVRKVASEILYIFEAPQMTIDETMKVKIPDMSELESWDGGAIDAQRMSYAKMKEKPKKYSLEWVAEQRIEAQPETDFGPIVLALVVSGLGFAWVSFVGPPSG